MAPTPLSAVHRTGLGHAAAWAAKHVVLAAVIEIAATRAHAPLSVRVVLGIGCLAGHWRVHKRRGG
jgi:hypothetical protein